MAVKILLLIKVFDKLFLKVNLGMRVAQKLRSSSVAEVVHAQQRKHIIPRQQVAFEVECAYDPLGIVSENDYDLEKGGFLPLQRWMKEHKLDNRLSNRKESKNGSDQPVRLRSVGSVPDSVDSMESEFNGNYILKDWLAFAESTVSKKN